jgi:hypothetical protein
MGRTPERCLTLTDTALLRRHSCDAPRMPPCWNVLHGAPKDQAPITWRSGKRPLEILHEELPGALRHGR